MKSITIYDLLNIHTINIAHFVQILNILNSFSSSCCEYITKLVKRTQPIAV